MDSYIFCNSEGTSGEKHNSSGYIVCQGYKVFIERYANSVEYCDIGKHEHSAKEQRLDKNNLQQPDSTQTSVHSGEQVVEQHIDRLCYESLEDESMRETEIDITQEIQPILKVKIGNISTYAVVDVVVSLR